jgi:hypothetical protein
MSRVLFAPQVRRYFNMLIPTLHTLGYFDHLEGSRKYVKRLVDGIIAGLPTSLHKPAPPHFDRYGKGMWYAAFRHNRATTWYAFFTRYDSGGEIVYLVRYIANNHTAAQYL